MDDASDEQRHEVELTRIGPCGHGNLLPYVRHSSPFACNDGHNVQLATCTAVDKCNVDRDSAAPRLFSPFSSFFVPSLLMTTTPQ